jgi:hypothetical protein
MPMLAMSDDSDKFFATLRFVADKCAEGDVLDAGTFYALTIVDFLGRLQQVPPELRENLAYGVVRLAEAAMWLGVRRSSDLNPFLESQAELKRAEWARRGKMKLDARNRENLKAAIKDEARAQGRTPSISIEFARLIRPGVCARLKIDCGADWPSDSTIKNAISEIKNSVKTNRVTLS